MLDCTDLQKYHTTFCMSISKRVATLEKIDSRHGGSSVASLLLAHDLST